MRSDRHGTKLRARLAALGAATLIGMAGAGVAGCGDDDGEGPLEEAGQAADDAAGDLSDAAGEAAEDITDSDEAQEAAQEAEEAAGDVQDAAEEGLNEATTDDGE